MRRRYEKARGPLGASVANGRRGRRTVTIWPRRDAAVGQGGRVDPEPKPLAAESKDLLTRASGWFGDAMNAWSNGEHEKVAGLAPLAVELTLKAYLWQVSPPLLTQLDQRQEHSLIALSTGAKLHDPKLRTIGLSESLRRAVTVAGSEPKVSKAQRERLVASRNGSMHLGGVTQEISRHVLTDCIRVIAWIHALLGRPDIEFFGSHLADCRALLEQGRSEVAQIVLARLAKHRKRYEDLVAGLHEEVLDSTICGLEGTSMKEHWPTDERSPEVIPARHGCPACKRTGAVYGPYELEVEGEGEFEDGSYSYHAFTIVRLFPEWFICNVCGLRLSGPLELEAAGVAHGAYDPESDDLDFVPDFDDEWSGDDR